jgi:hypothetical protein
VPSSESQPAAAQTEFGSCEISAVLPARSKWFGAALNDTGFSLLRMDYFDWNAHRDAALAGYSELIWARSRAAIRLHDVLHSTTLATCVLVYSYLKATMGSTCVARRAGK